MADWPRDVTMPSLGLFFGHTLKISVYILRKNYGHGGACTNYEFCFIGNNNVDSSFDFSRQGGEESCLSTYSS
jgi:hypothetical protein